MKKIATVFAALALVIGIQSLVATTVRAVEVVFVPENTNELCHDSIDNDDNGATDEADESCAAFIVDNVDVDSPVPEDSEAMCHNERDDDMDGLEDNVDPDCAAYYPSEVVFVPENTNELCHDSIDNDDNGATDEADESCAAFIVDNTDKDTPVVIAPSPAPTHSRGGGSSSSVINVSNGQLSSGQVLGASTEDETCGAMITSFLKKGKNNDSTEVKKLQNFLNAKVDAKLPVTGFFGSLTESAVMKFQINYKEQILAPWVTLKLLPNIDTATGYVYKTTLFAINKMICPSNTTPAPVLP